MSERIVLTPTDTGWTVEPLFSSTHLGRSDCGSCKKPVGRVALINLVYRFESCNCGDPEYVHLVEQPYHVECFQP